VENRDPRPYTDNVEPGRTSQPKIDPCAFVAAVKPLLERKDHQSLFDLCKQRWTPEQIVSLLSCDDCDARKVAALGLSLVGTKCCLPSLVERLKDPDPVVNQMAEHAIWAIWFRGGNDESNHQVCRGTLALNRKDIEHAIRHFDRAIEISPAFAEAYNQRAIAHYLTEDYKRSLCDCRRAVERMPVHFGAWAGMGHCHAHLGHMPDSLVCYEKALAINPHYEGVRQTIREIKSRMEIV
jgi:tetratricopeptide (TPR) repeat protein